MANIKSQIKRNRQNERRRLRNKAARSEIKTRIKAVLAALDEGDEERIEEKARIAVKRIDKAAQKGIIHKNKAARLKSRLHKKIASAGSRQDA